MRHIRPEAGAKLVETFLIVPEEAERWWWLPVLLRVALVELGILVPGPVQHDQARTGGQARLRRCENHNSDHYCATDLHTIFTSLRRCRETAGRPRLAFLPYEVRRPSAPAQ